jgi:hypothetical protein
VALAGEGLALAVIVKLLDVDADHYRAHGLHATERSWTETNCYVDLWVEVLHSLGAEPLAACAFTLSAGFEGDQWTFIKFPPEDIRALFGIEVSELAVWRPIPDHVVEHLEGGRLLTIEVDSWFLPDTVGTAYRADHVKTTIVPQMIDPESRRLGYFHNAGYFELEGDDYEGLFAPALLAPYVELVKLDRFTPSPPDLVARSAAQAVEHLARRPRANPVAEMAARLQTDLGWLAEQGLDAFHQYAFVTVRQCGACAELAASYVEWLEGAQGERPSGAAAAFQNVAETAKSLQFGLARIARGRQFDIGPALDDMASSWDQAMTELDRRHGA